MSRLWLWLRNLFSSALPGKQTALVLAEIRTLRNYIMATNAQLAAQLASAADQTTKALGEITAEIATLTAAVEAAGAVDPAVQASADRLTALAGNLDDLNPDAPPPVAP